MLYNFTGHKETIFLVPIIVPTLVFNLNLLLAKAGYTDPVNLTSKLRQVLRLHMRVYSYIAFAIPQ